MIAPISINGSVGAGGRNTFPEVKLVQNQLNLLMDGSRVQLAVDGLVGPKTCGMIRDFQTNVVMLARADSRVDPGGRTLRSLNDPASKGVWANKPASPSGPTPAPVPSPYPNTGQVTIDPQDLAKLSPPEAQVFNQMVEETERQSSLAPARELLAYLIKTEVQVLKKVLSLSMSAIERVEMLAGFVMMRVVGATIPKIAAIIKTAIGLGQAGFGKAMAMVRFIRRSRDAALELLRFSATAYAATVMATVIDAAEFFRTGVYAKGFRLLQSLGTQLMLPWSEFVSLVRELIYAINTTIRGNAKFVAALGLVKACNPLNAARAGISIVLDFVETSIRSLFDGTVSVAQIEQLARDLAANASDFWDEIKDAANSWMNQGYVTWLRGWLTS